MRLQPYLMFSGQCEAAFNFYAQCLGGTIDAMLPFGGAPTEGQVPAEWHGKIMHARLSVGKDALMGSDAPPGHQDEAKGFHVTLQFTDPAEAERVFHALAEDGTVRMALQETFWAARFAMLVDRFGTPWMINCERPA